MQCVLGALCAKVEVAENNACGRITASQLYKEISGQEDGQSLQKDLDRVAEWSDKWKMKLNTDKIGDTAKWHTPTFRVRMIFRDNRV